MANSTIKYVGPFEGLNVGDLVFPRGEAVEVESGLAKELLGRDDFERPKARKTPAKKTPVKAGDKDSVATATDEDPTADAVVDPPQEG